MRAIAASFLWLLVSVSTLAQSSPDPVLLSGLLPQYPRVPQTAHISGELRASFQVDVQGKVTDVQIISGPMLLRTPTEESLRSRKFDASTLDNNGGQIDTMFSYRFTEGCPKTPTESQTTSVTLRNIHHVEIIASLVCAEDPAQTRKSK
jgi:hypothetical protein